MDHFISHIDLVFNEKLSGIGGARMGVPCSWELLFTSFDQPIPILPMRPWSSLPLKFYFPAK